MSAESLLLYRQYIPPNAGRVQFYEGEEYGSVVARIAQVMPPTDLFKFFSSWPSETGGISRFPYERVDADLITARTTIFNLNRDYQRIKGTQNYVEDYELGCRLAFKAMVWTEIGFQGLENLATSLDSVNWTAAVGNFVSLENRAKKIMIDGKRLYDGCLRTFAQYHFSHDVPVDYFRQYNVTYLLEKYK